MRWNTRAVEGWTPWVKIFALYPRYIGFGQWAWLEYIETRKYHSGWYDKRGTTHYRYIGDTGAGSVNV